MGINDNACLLDKRVVLKSIASKLAPTLRCSASHNQQAKKNGALTKCAVKP